MVEDNSQFYTFLGTVLTGVLALMVLIVNQFFEMKKSAITKQFIETDAAHKDGTLDHIRDLVNSQLTTALREISDLKRIVASLIKSPNPDMLNLEAQMAIEKKNGETKKQDEALAGLPEIVPVVLEAEVKIGEIEKHESGDVRMKKVDKPK